MLNVPGDLIADMGAVSEAVARVDGGRRGREFERAYGSGGDGRCRARRRHEDEAVGLVHIAAAREGRSILHEAHRFGDIGREEIRLKTVEASLLLLQRLL